MVPKRAAESPSSSWTTPPPAPLPPRQTAQFAQSVRRTSQTATPVRPPVRHPDADKEHTTRCCMCHRRIPPKHRLVGGYRRHSPSHQTGSRPHQNTRLPACTPDHASRSASPPTIKQQSRETPTRKDTENVRSTGSKKPGERPGAAALRQRPTDARGDRVLPAATRATLNLHCRESTQRGIKNAAAGEDSRESDRCGSTDPQNA